MTNRPAWTLFALLGLGCATGSGTDMPLPDQLQGSSDPYAAPTPPTSQPVDSSVVSMGAQMLEPIDCSVQPPGYAQVAAFNTCVMCHAASRAAAARHSAPPSVNFDSEAAALNYANEAVTMVMAGAMPPRASGLTLTNAEKQQLYTWAMCSM
jgi:hypothetical protein